MCSASGARHRPPRRRAAVMQEFGALAALWPALAGRVVAALREAQDSPLEIRGRDATFNPRLPNHFSHDCGGSQRYLAQLRMDFFCENMKDQRKAVLLAQKAPESQVRALNDTPRSTTATLATSSESTNTISSIDVAMADTIALSLFG